MQEQRREILSQVAAGKLSAEEGAARLDAVEAEVIPAERLPAPPAAVSSAPAGRLVRLNSQFGSAEIVGDPSVAFAIADGPHRARQEGDTMVIEHQPFDDDDSFSFGHGGSRRIVVNGLAIERRKLTCLLYTSPSPRDS